MTVLKNLLAVSIFFAPLVAAVPRQVPQKHESIIDDTEGDTQEEEEEGSARSWLGNSKYEKFIIPCTALVLTVISLVGWILERKKQLNFKNDANKKLLQPKELIQPTIVVTNTMPEEETKSPSIGALQERLMDLNDQTPSYLSLEDIDKDFSHIQFVRDSESEKSQSNPPLGEQEEKNPEERYQIKIDELTLATKGGDFKEVQRLIQEFKEDNSLVAKASPAALRLLVNETVKQICSAILKKERLPLQEWIGVLNSLSELFYIEYDPKPLVQTLIKTISEVAQTKPAYQKFPSWLFEDLRKLGAPFINSCIENVLLNMCGVENTKLEEKDVETFILLLRALKELRPANPVEISEGKDGQKSLEVIALMVRTSVSRNQIDTLTRIFEHLAPLDRKHLVRKYGGAKQNNLAISHFVLVAMQRLVEGEQINELKRLLIQWKRLDPEFELKDFRFDTVTQVWQIKPKTAYNKMTLLEFVKNPSSELFKFLRDKGCYFSKNWVLEAFRSLEEVIKTKELKGKKADIKPDLQTQVASLSKTFAEQQIIASDWNFTIEEKQLIRMYAAEALRIALLANDLKTVDSLVESIEALSKYREGIFLWKGYKTQLKVVAFTSFASDNSLVLPYLQKKGIQQRGEMSEQTRQRLRENLGITPLT